MAPDPIGDHVAVASAEQLLRDQALAALTDHAVGVGQVSPWQSGLVLDHIRDLTALVRLLAAAPAGVRSDYGREAA